MPRWTKLGLENEEEQKLCGRIMSSKDMTSCQVLKTDQSGETRQVKQTPPSDENDNAEKIERMRDLLQH